MYTLNTHGPRVIINSLKEKPWKKVMVPQNHQTNVPLKFERSFSIRALLTSYTYFCSLEVLGIYIYIHIFNIYLYTCIHMNLCQISQDPWYH